MPRKRHTEPSQPMIGLYETGYAYGRPIGSIPDMDWSMDVESSREEMARTLLCRACQAKPGRVCDIEDMNNTRCHTIRYLDAVDQGLLPEIPGRRHIRVSAYPPAPAGHAAGPGPDPGPVEPVLDAVEPTASVPHDDGALLSPGR